MTKKCTKCGEEKEQEEFNKNKYNKDGIDYWCKKCNSINAAQWRMDNKERLKYAKAKYHQLNKEKHNKKSAEEYLKNRDKYLKFSKEWVANNPKKKKEIALKWYYRNREKSIAISVRSNKKRYKTSPEYRLVVAMRGMLTRVLKLTGIKKNSKTEISLGFKKDELVEYISLKFQEGMSWKNFGEWEIDHIIPVSLLISKGIKAPSEINALINLQPLWKKENRAKRNYFTPTNTSSELLEYYGLPCN